jgi:putative effector of murein hydrolase
MRENKAQFTDAEVAEAINGLGATVLKPRKAKRTAMRVKSSKGLAKGTSGFAVGYPRKVFI